jgi:hypothetical protein
MTTKTKSVTVTTAGMGSCQCGDCFCEVFADGTIKYRGTETWQQSERRPFLRELEPRRPYGSQLYVEEHAVAMIALAGAL